jgi:putative Holliday junction resolvase
VRYLAIDYGRCRIGLAYGEGEPGVAVPIAPILRLPPWDALERIVEARRVAAIVLGHPLGPDGQVGCWARRVEAFGRRLRERFNLPVYLADERLTTWAVERGLEDLGRRPGLAQLRKERRTGHVDSRAAALLLQDFLDGQRLAKCEGVSDSPPKVWGAP